MAGVAREPSSVAAPSIDVPSYHGGGGRRGATDSPGPVGLIEEKWRAPIAGDVPSAPAIVDGVAYVDDGEQSLYAVDARDGTVRWQTDLVGDGYGTAAGGTPTVADGVAYATSGDGLAAVDLDDGAVLWRVDGLAEGTPAVAGDRVFVGDGHGLAAADRDGHPRWRYAEGDDRLDAASLHHTPTAADGLVHVGVDDRASLTNRTVYAFDPDGGRAWTTRTGYAAHTTAAVADGTVFYGARDRASDGDGAVLALDADDGAVRWEHRIPGRVAKPTVADGTVYAGTSAGVFALDAADGAVQWSFERDRAPTDRYELSDTAPVEGDSPVVASNALYVPAPVGDGTYLYALSRRDGTRL